MPEVVVPPLPPWSSKREKMRFYDSMRKWILLTGTGIVDNLPAIVLGVATISVSTVARLGVSALSKGREVEIPGNGSGRDEAADGRDENEWSESGETHFVFERLQRMRGVEVNEVVSANPMKFEHPSYRLLITHQSLVSFVWYSNPKIS